MSPKSHAEPLWRLALLLCLAGTLTVAAACRTPRDLDGLPAGASSLPLNQWRTDQLHCKRGDCADWYRVVVAKRGHLNIEMSAPVFDSQAHPMTLTLADEHARSLDETGSSEPTLTVGSPLKPGPFLVRVKSPEQQRRALGYDIIAHFVKWEPPPPPAPLPPQFEVLESEVLEHERRPGEPESVLLSRGRQDGLVENLYGRLLNGDAEIARIQLIDVYPDGSRARLLDTPQAVITPSTRAEIDIPVSGSKSKATPKIAPRPAPNPAEPGSALRWQN